MRSAKSPHEILKMKFETNGRPLKTVILHWTDFGQCSNNCYTPEGPMVCTPSGMHTMHLKGRVTPILTEGWGKKPAAFSFRKATSWCKNKQHMQEAGWSNSQRKKQNINKKHCFWVRSGFCWGLFWGQSRLTPAASNTPDFPPNLWLHPTPIRTRNRTPVAPMGIHGYNAVSGRGTHHLSPWHSPFEVVPGVHGPHYANSGRDENWIYTGKWWCLCCNWGKLCSFVFTLDEFAVLNWKYFMIN